MAVLGHWLTSRFDFKEYGLLSGCFLKGQEAPPFAEWLSTVSKHGMQSPQPLGEAGGSDHVLHKRKLNLII